MCMFAATSVVK